jgi:voltage-gated potassium channel
MRRIIAGTIVFVAILIVSTAGYMVAGWSFLDAFYQVIITVFGVGFGEINTMTPTLRVFTIFVIVAGYTSVGYIVGAFIQMITEGEVRRALGARRMEREILTLRDHVIICGYGRMGQILARELKQERQSFVIIDNNSDRATQAEAQGYLVRIGSATDETVLESAGIAHARSLATVLPDDAVNVFITLTARSLNPRLVILARGEYPTTERKLLQAGADRVVSPAAIGALRMAQMITHPAALDFLNQEAGRANLNELLTQIDMQIDELPIAPSSDLVGCSIGTLEVKGQSRFIIVAIRRADGSIVLQPDPQVFVREGDYVIVLGRRGEVPKFASQHSTRKQIRYRGAKL